MEYRKKRDTLFTLEYDEVALKPKGGVSNPYDIHFNQAMAEKMYFNFSQGREDTSQTETIERQWTHIQGLVQEDYMKTEALNTALKEERKLRALLEHVYANPGVSFVVPKRHSHLTNVLKGVRGGKFQSWVLMPADVKDIVDDDEKRPKKKKTLAKSNEESQQESALNGSESDEEV